MVIRECVWELYTLNTTNKVWQSVIMVRFRFTFCKLSNPSEVVYAVINTV